MTYENDIPHSAALDAYRGTSFVPESRAAQVRRDYAESLSADYAELAKDLPEEMIPTLDEEFDRYRAGYRKRLLALLHSKSRVFSPMISGPANFPTRRMEKRNRVVNSRMEDLSEYRTRALAAIERKIHPERRPIMSGDDNAPERLRQKIASLDALQEKMKAANAAIRKHAGKDKEAQIAALVTLDFSEAIADLLVNPKESYMCQGFEKWQLSNNNANIRRLKKRLQVIERAKAQPVTERTSGDIRIEDNPADHRVRLFWPSKPDEETRAKLKRQGFRFSRSLGCWQACRNRRTLEYVNTL